MVPNSSGESSFLPGGRGWGALSPFMDGGVHLEKKKYPKVSFQREGQPKNIKALVIVQNLRSDTNSM